MLFAQRLGTWSDKALGHFGGSLIVPQSSVCTAHQIHPTDIRGLHQKGDNGKVWYRALQSAGVGVLANDIRNAVRKKNGIMWGKFPKWGAGSDPNPLLDVCLFYLKFFGEDKKCS